MECPRLHLRKITPDDLDALVDLDSDPEVMKYISGGRPYLREDYEGKDGFLARMCLWAEEPYGYFAAELDGRFVGWFHLRPSVADSSILELGYRLARKAWGKGLATEGARALCRLAFEELGQSQIDACALEGNEASFKVMRKCGMREVGRMTHPMAGDEVIRYLGTAESFREALRQDSH